jgi:hypothetical protein
VREILLAPDSPLLRPGERGFNFRTVRTDHRRGDNNLPTEVPIVFGDSRGGLAGDGKGQLYVSLDSPFITEPNGKLQIDRLGTSNLAPLIVGGQINPALAANNIEVIKDTHGKTSHLSESDLEALILYLKSLSSKTKESAPTPTPSPSPSPSTTHFISGRVTNASGAGLGGVKISLSGSKAATVTTLSDGTYRLASLPAGGQYTVKASKLGFIFTPSSRTFSSLSSNQTACSFTGAAKTFTISGKVTKAGTTTGLGGVTISLSGSRSVTTTTLADGTYKFTSLPAGGNYAVKPTKSGYSFTSASRSYSNLSANQAAANFTGSQQSAMSREPQSTIQPADNVLARYYQLLRLVGG